VGTQRHCPNHGRISLDWNASRLMRFDGVRFVSWQPPEGKELRHPAQFSARSRMEVCGLEPVWVSPLQNGNLTAYRDAPGSIMAILRTAPGTIWIARANLSDAKGPLCKVADRSPMLRKR